MSKIKFNEAFKHNLYLTPNLFYNEKILKVYEGNEVYVPQSIVNIFFQRNISNNYYYLCCYLISCGTNVTKTCEQ